jgi:hypothetical protein
MRSHLVDRPFLTRTSCTRRTAVGGVRPEKLWKRMRESKGVNSKKLYDRVNLRELKSELRIRS